MLFRTLFLIVISTSVIWGQLVKTDPAFSTEQDSFSVIFNAALGDAGLKGYNGDDIYAHTGVTIEGEGDWKNVVAEWNQNINKAKLTSLGNDLWQLKIGFPHSYYNVPSNKKITKLSFVFRNADGSVTGRDLGGADIFLTLYEGGLTMAISKPQVNTRFGDAQRSPYFLAKGEQLNIEAVAATIGTTLKEQALYLAGNLLHSTTDDTLKYTYSPGAESGMQLFKSIGEDVNGLKDSSYFAVMVLPETIDAAMPNGIKAGINYTSPTTATLSLFAPNKKHVFVLGDFNDWYVDAAYMMKRSTTNGQDMHWWLELSGLSPGKEYAFQYLVDGEIRIADPYTQKILDPWNDKYISDLTYPQLKPYPVDKTEQAVAILQTGKQPYTWQTTNFVAPKKKELIIYELLVRDFVETHNYQTLIDTLNYLQNLGVNAIELMPVNEFEGNESWGYNPSFLFAVDKYYGTAEKLKAFIDACHQRGIAVIIDMVLNHSYGQSPFVRLYASGTYGPVTAENPWFNVSSPNPVFSWGEDFDHTSAATKELVKRVNNFWLNEFKVDGFRFDFTKGFTNKSGDGWAYDAGRIQILKDMANGIWQTNPNAYVILEHFAENSEEKVLANYGMLLWGNMNSKYNEATMGYNTNGKSDLSWGYYKNRGWNQPHLVSYMESHDEERLMFKNKKYGNSAGNYNIKQQNTALERNKMAATLFFVQPGPKMIWQFGELGYDFSIDENGRTGNKPIKWNYFNDAERRRLYNTYAALLKLRKENPVFYDGQAQVSLAVSSVNKRIVLAHAELDASVIANFGVTASEVNPAFTKTGKWYDFFSGDSIEVNDVNAKIALGPGAFHIYTSKKLFKPEGNPVTSLSHTNIKNPKNMALKQNYPNPFNPVTYIAFSLLKTADVELVLYDMLGRKIKTLFKGIKTAGEHKYLLNGENLSSGTYFYALKAEGFTLTKKMMLIK